MERKAVKPGGRSRTPANPDEPMSLEEMQIDDEYDKGSESGEVSAAYDVWNVMAIGAGVLSLALVVYMYPVWFAEKKRLKPVVVQEPRRVQESPAPPKRFNPERATKGQLPVVVGEIAGSSIKVATWNLEPPTFNPFEFWLTSKPHDELFRKAEAALNVDVTVSEVFTESMFQELKDTITPVDRIPTCLIHYWDELKAMKLADALSRIETKGYIERVDPTTNPLVQKEDTHYRPSPLTCSQESVSDPAKWWATWLNFMFKLDVMIEGRTGTVYGLMKSKQCTGTDVMSLAVYDAIMLWVLQKADPDWEKLKRDTCKLLFQEQHSTVAKVLASQNDVDAILLQGVTQRMLELIREKAAGPSMFLPKVPVRFDPDSSKNTVILLKSGRFIGMTDESHEVFNEELGGTATLVTATRLDAASSKMVFASISGKTAESLEAAHNYVATSELLRQGVFGVAMHDSPDLKELRSLRKLVPLNHTTTARYAKTALQRAFSESVKDPTAEAQSGVTSHLFFSAFDFKEVSRFKVNSAAMKYNSRALQPSIDYPLHRALVGGVLDPKNTAYQDRVSELGKLRESLVPTPLPTEATPAPEKMPVPEAATAGPASGSEGSTSAQPAASTVNGTGESHPSDGSAGLTQGPDGSLILPPPGVGCFINLPEGAVFPPEAESTTRHITVTAVVDNGLGDRLGSLYSSISLAYFLKAKFHLLWNVNNECMARGSMLFNFNGSLASIEHKSETDNLEMKLKGREDALDAIITLTHHFSTGKLVNPSIATTSAPLNDGSWHTGESRKVSVDPNGELVKWALDRHARGKRVHILHHVDRLVKGTNLKIVAEAMKHFGFRINPVLMARVDKFTEAHKINPKNTVGVHLRGTDARIPLRMTDVITDVRLKFPSRTFFVASDDKKAEAKFLQAFAGRAVKNTMKVAFPGMGEGCSDWRCQGKLGALRFNVQRTEPAVIDALTDMAILSRTERPIIDGVIRDSSFGKMSTTLCVIRLSCGEELGAIAESVQSDIRPGT